MLHHKKWAQAQLHKELNRDSMQRESAIKHAAAKVTSFNRDTSLHKTHFSGGVEANA